MSITRNWPVGMVLAYFAVVVGLVIGWVMNIVALVGGPELAQWTTLEVLRVVGIFVAPLGGVLGGFDMGRTVNILDDITDKVTTVEFTDSDGERYQISQIGDNGNLLKLNRLDCEEDFVESVIFMKHDIDKLIALFQAAKQYNI